MTVGSEIGWHIRSNLRVCPRIYETFWLTVSYYYVYLTPGILRNLAWNEG
jgi:hypothetical protein